MVFSKIENSIIIILPLVNCATASNGYDEFCYCDTCSENEGDCDAHDESGYIKGPEIEVW